MSISTIRNPFVCIMLGWTIKHLMAGFGIDGRRGG
jgi:hypothetical protein